MVILIWAQTKKGVIGLNNKLPWNIKEEMQHFINSTKNKTILMGRNTWESLTIKPLPNRQNILITSRSLEKRYNNVEISTDLDLILEKYRNSQEDLYVIGGLQIYLTALKFADKLIISEIKKEYNGDTFAPKWDKKQYRLESKTEFEEFIVYVYERN
ncbi:dihydrofolate reductase [Spiroplasma taiwanense]|uniref:Dihydrofolate reductase n=1 Tax=Spiroplasma taiwanense CT-1 TaxID=1276220 RepID=S5LUG7_9MOLU|nr:dihydrofolate reductase [Spiroplasma taiwanense]AGR41434.1 dihydrofolate reductase [Spiroplasma taiwanense CT-1]